MKSILSLVLINLVLTVGAVQAAPKLTIHHANGSETLDRAQLEAMPQISLTTQTPYFDGDVAFSGPSVQQLLDRYEVTDDAEVTLRALNNYQVSVEARELRQLGAIVATRMNGKTMSVRNRGPFWVMLPLSERPELDHEDYHRLMIWQLSEIDLD